MRRRAFIALATGVAAWPIAGFALSPGMATIGMLLVKSAGSEQLPQGLRRALQSRGYVEGQNVRFEVRSDEGSPNRLPDLAAELVRLKVDVIVTWYTPAALAAKKTTSDIPIVMAMAGDPIDTGLVQSLARPGGNVTGTAGVGAELAGKDVELVRELLPAAHRITALVNAPDPFSKPFLETLRQAGAATRITIDPIMLNGSAGLDAAFATMAKAPTDAVIVQPSLGLRQPVALALQYRIPALSVFREFVEAGGLMTLAVSEDDIYRSTARFVDNILKGAKPAELPVERPTLFKLVLNLKTAQALGLTFPRSLLARADEVIE
ncbi:MAG TPA: ABC transporter substrate-binding protein [Stellaceae bacterium]|jgi:putative ABC transport system substrate-binding protein|nr:ABC transporter substrate-binding protein [Stellaceae bacterium]